MRGPVDAATLGRVLMHEHVFVFGAEIQQNYPDAWGDEESRVGDAVAKLRAQGYSEKLVLSQDASCFMDWFPEDARAAAAPNWHYNHISDDVLLALRERGVTEDQITTMLVDNPRHYFGG